MAGELIIKPIDGVGRQVVENAEGAEIQVLLGPEEGMPNFYTRLFTLAPGARIPVHRHPTVEHQQVVLEGEMVVLLETGEEKIARAGDVVYFPVKVAHGYENRTTAPVKFICVVPSEPNYETEWV
jgi:quercetin dioxygenase-like cupin family protein